MAKHLVSIYGTLCAKERYLVPKLTRPGHTRLTQMGHARASPSLNQRQAAVPGTQDVA